MSLEHWESFHRSGALVSCPVGLQPGYTGSLRDAWEEFFSQLANGARVVDIGTGNGAIALIAKETAQALGREFEIHGVDLAEIDPPRYVPNGQTLLEGIRFHSRVPAESLPLNATSVDAVCGQYALEFTDIPRMLAEAFRVLRPRACCQFVLHHRDSIFVHNAQESLEHATYVLDDSKVLRKLRRFCELEHEAPARAHAAWRDLALLSSELTARAKASKSSLTQAFVNRWLRNMFENRGSLSHGQIMTAIDTFERELRASVHRLQDIVGAALSVQDLAAISREAQVVGFEGVTYVPQLQGADLLVGWKLNLAKP